LATYCEGGLCVSMHSWQSHYCEPHVTAWFTAIRRCTNTVHTDMCSTNTIHTDICSTNSPYGYVQHKQSIWICAMQKFQFQLPSSHPKHFLSVTDCVHEQSQQAGSVTNSCAIIFSEEALQMTMFTYTLFCSGWPQTRKRFRIPFLLKIAEIHTVVPLWYRFSNIPTHKFYKIELIWAWARSNCMSR
jgi:hypothetical protein